MRKAGIEESDIPAYLGEIDCFGVHPDNKEAICWFMLMQRRWKISGTSGRIQSLDDSALLAQMEMRGVKRKHREKLLDELMVMESAALEVLNKPKEQNGRL